MKPLPSPVRLRASISSPEAAAMARATLALGMILGCGETWGQTTVYNRSDSSSGLWWDDTNHPWWYGSAPARARPDYNSDFTATGTYNHLIYDHNNQLTGTVNGTQFNVASLTLASTADSSRTFNASVGGSIRLDSHIQNNSTALHTFNVPITLNGSSVEFRASSGNLAFNGSITTDGKTLGLTGGHSIAVGGAISDGSGAGQLAITGNTTATLTGNNSYTGGTTVAAGSTLRIGAGGTSGAISGTGTLNNSGSVVFHRSNDISYSGVISGTGSVLKDGNGKLSLSSGSSDFSGGLTIRAGSVNWNSNSALGTGTVTLNDASTGIEGTALLRNSSGTLSNPVVVADQGTGITTIGRESGTQNVIYSGTLSLGRSATLFSGTEDGLVRFSNTISGAGGVTIGGVGRIEMLGDNTYSGTTTISSGRLQLGNGGTTGSVGTGAIDLSGGTLVINRSNSPVFANAVNATSGGNRFVEVATGTSATLSGVVTGVGEFWKSGAGTLTLTNASNSFSNSIVIQSGTLRVEAMSHLGGSGNLFIGESGSGTFSYAGSGSESTAKLGAAALQGATGNTIEIIQETANLTITSNIGQTGTDKSLIKTGAGTLTLSGANSYTGATTISGGTLVINGNQSSATGDVSVASGARLGGTGTMGGNTSISGTYSPGAAGAVGSLAFNGKNLTFNTGSIFDWDVSSESLFDQTTGIGTLSGGGGVFNVITDISSAFWNANQTFISVFNTGSLDSVFSLFQLNGESLTGGLVAGKGAFSFSSGNVVWTAIPEPSTALAGLLLAAGILRRSR